MTYLCHKFLLILVLFGTSICQGHANNSPLPQLYTFDDYDTCFSNGKSALSSTYCMVYAQVQPDNSSDLWKKIETHKLHRFNYHYDKLFFGVCLERCVHTMDIEAQKETLGIIDKEIVEDLQSIHKRPLDIEMRAKYSLMIQKCLNEEFQRKYDLKLNTFIEYCERPKETEQLEEDAAETILYKIINGLGLLVLFSSFYDYYLKTHPADGVHINEHFKNNYEDSVSRLLTSFSVPRNYNRLVQPYRGKIAIDFSYLDGLRSVSTLIVLHGHIFYMEFLHLQNPEYFENIVNSTIGLALHNLTPIIEIFMVMSGLLFYMKFKEMSIIKPQTSWGKCIKLLLLITVGRFLRFLPSIGLLILINGTVLTKFSDGPFWRHITEPCRTFSRENWWQNILMINNFYPKTSVSTHTWYLAADFQLFTFYTMVLILISKYPQYKKRILITLGFITVLIPTIVTYIFQVDSPMIVQPEGFRYGFYKGIKTFKYLYTPSYTNLGGYLFGICCAELYMKYLNKDEVQREIRKKILYKISVWLTFPIALGITLLGTFMVFQPLSIWTALFSGLYRNAWIIFVCGIPVLTMACKPESISYKFFCLPIFRILARLSFQMYLWHFIIMQLINGYQRQPHHITHLYMNVQGLTTIILSLIAAFASCLLVEFPTAQVFDTLMSGYKKGVANTGVNKRTKIQ